MLRLDARDLPMTTSSRAAVEAVRGSLRVLAYEDLLVTEPRPAALQRIAARREGEPTHA